MGGSNEGITNNMMSNNLEKKSISLSASGDNIVIAAPSEGYIAIEHINFIPSSAVTVTIKDGDLEYAYPLDAKQAFTIENSIGSEKGIITCKAKTAFILNLSSAVSVNGMVRYQVII
jgi:hypothetical protein